MKFYLPSPVSDLKFLSFLRYTVAHTIAQVLRRGYRIHKIRTIFLSGYLSKFDMMESFRNA